MEESIQQLTFRLADDLARRFRAALALAGRTQQDFLVESVTQYIAKQEKENAIRQ